MNKYIKMIEELEDIRKVYPEYKMLKCKWEGTDKISLYMAKLEKGEIAEKKRLANCSFPYLYQYYGKKAKDSEWKTLGSLMVKFKNRQKKLNKKHKVKDIVSEQMRVNWVTGVRPEGWELPFGVPNLEVCSKAEPKAKENYPASKYKDDVMKHIHQIDTLMKKIDSELKTIKLLTMIQG